VLLSKLQEFAVSHVDDEDHITRPYSVNKLGKIGIIFRYLLELKNGDFSVLTEMA
jgi:hypothetical protein